MGVSTSLLYSTADAFRSIRDNITTVLLTSVTLAFSLAIVALFLIVFVNLNGVVATWGDRTHIVAYLEDGAAEAGSGPLEKRLLRFPGVQDARYVSKEAALDDLRAELKEHEGILEGVDLEPLPASFEIMVEEAYREPEKIKETVQKIEALEWVTDVQYGAEWVEKFSAFLNFIELSALVVGVFLAVATVFIISNTIRLTVYARKEEIGIMRLVGASNLYIKVPFFIEGFVQGFFGGVLALGILFFCRYLVTLRVPQYFIFVVDLPLSPGVLLSLLVISGACLGVVGSLVSMGRFLR